MMLAEMSELKIIDIGAIPDTYTLTAPVFFAIVEKDGKRIKYEKGVWDGELTDEEKLQVLEAYSKHFSALMKKPVAVKYE